LCKNQEGGGLENNSKYFYNITINKSHGKGLSDRIKKKKKKTRRVQGLCYRYLKNKDWVVITLKNKRLKNNLLKVLFGKVFFILKIYRNNNFLFYFFNLFLILTQ